MNSPIVISRLRPASRLCSRTLSHQCQIASLSSFAALNETFLLRRSRSSHPFLGSAPDERDGPSPRECRGRSSAPCRHGRGERSEPRRSPWPCRGPASSPGRGSRRSARRRTSASRPPLSLGAAAFLAGCLRVRLGSHWCLADVESHDGITNCPDSARVFCG
jgi:hypothetical protein